ncbi:MAG: ATP synthase F0 subunit B [Deltaproteobacteria bacterium]|nr:ATP synthase F0 subunit B [Deltaproteobacteria bacterium]
MKKLPFIKRCLILLGVILVLFAAVPAWGSEGPGTVRKIWDTVWLFINFGILAFFLVKYGRKPLMDYLVRHGSEIGQDLDRVRDLLAKAEDEYKESEKSLAELEQRIAEIETITQKEAQRARQRILAGAEQNSAKILDEAREVAESEIKKAWSQAKTELVEMAIVEAEKRIREQIKLEDETRIIEEYVGRLSAQNQSS